MSRTDATRGHPRARPQDPDELVRAAITHHRTGRLAEAVALYERALAERPAHPDALHLLGVAALQRGEHARAVELIRRAVSAKPEDARCRNDLGEALRSLGRSEEAERSYRGALRYAPEYADAWSNLGALLLETNRSAEAVEALREAVRIAPGLLEAHYNLGNALRDRGEPEAALAAYRTAERLLPNAPQIHTNIGGTLEALGRSEEAIAAWRHAIALAPDHAEAYASLGLALVRRGRIREAVPSYRRALELRRAPDTNRRSLRRGEQHTTRAKLVHDVEQLEYLLEKGLIERGHERTVADLRWALERLAPEFEHHWKVELPADVLARIGPAWNRLFHYRETPALAGPAVRTDLDTSAIQEHYARNAPGITWVDEFLTHEALVALRRFCLESTIWYRCESEHGYVAAVMDEGFLCPLLAQIAQELPRRLPAIFGAHPLTQTWAFKYDSECTGGVGLHADFAAVNVNFWITPDEANLDPDRGGLIVWDREAPLEWGFERYNTDHAAIAEYLERCGANAVRVPYRANRALVFDSDLFHRTDDLRFRPGYENRRVNVTMLYGVREDEKGASHGDD